MKILLSSSYPEGFGLEPKPRMTPYHQVFLASNEEVKEKKEEDLPSLSDGTVYFILLFAVLFCFSCIGGCGWVVIPVGLLHSLVYFSFSS